ncbi:hypothetical protein M426DRAFT_322609 [Hypoxylon sp. CI-4A]|nr:hypothetical protein M426DRAFT_322609 [Hypoxylon sp. CI-4A]
MAPLQEITTQEEWQAHVGSLPSSTLLLAFFYAPWAAPCTQMRAVLEALADEYAKPGVYTPTSWVGVNAEDVSEVSEIYDIEAVPFIVIQRNDAVLEKISGNAAGVIRLWLEKNAPLVEPAAKENGANPPPPATAAINNNNNNNNNKEEDGLSSEEDHLTKKLKGLVTAANVMLFMKGTPSEPQCGFSRQMVALLRERNVKYGFFNILADDDVRKGLKEFADWPTYPQLWIGGELVGGLDIVKEELSNDPNFLHPYSVEGQAAAGQKTAGITA